MKDDLSYIAEPLRSLAVKIDEVSSDPKNERMHNKKNIESIKGSLRRFGQRTPLVVNMANLKLIEKGAGTWQAAKELGWTHIAVMFVEDDENTAAGYRLADNRSGELAVWDDDALTETLKSLAEQDALEGLGWDEEELKHLIYLPEIGYREYTDNDFERAGDHISDNIHRDKDLQAVVCPKCGKEFFVDEKKV